MPAIKIHPPKPLPEQAISEQEFQDWKNELEIWLGEDDSMARKSTFVPSVERTVSILV